MQTRDQKTAELAALLEAEGITQARARALAEQVIEQQAGAVQGTVYGDLDSFGLARVWERATFAGVRRMTLHIEAQARALADDDGLLSVRVLDSETWPEWDDHAAHAGTLAGMVEAISNPRAGWSETDYMAHGEECPDVWQPSAEMQEAQARARAEGMN